MKSEIIQVDEHRRLAQMGAAFVLYYAPREDDISAALKKYEAKYKVSPQKVFVCRGYLYIPRFVEAR